MTIQEIGMNSHLGCGRVRWGMDQIQYFPVNLDLIRLFDLPSRQQLSSTMKELYIEYKYK